MALIISRRSFYCPNFATAPDRVIILTNRPTRVNETLAVDLPYPRDQVTTKELPEFAHLRARVYTAIKATKKPATAVTAA